MATDLPHIEDSTLTNYIPPKGAYFKFISDEDFFEFTRKWGLNTATSTKRTFWYKESYYKREVTIDGYENYSNGYQTVVIRFADGNLCCINPLYLKDMQKGTFGEETDEESVAEQVKQAKEKNANKPVSEAKPASTPITLPTGKVSFTGTLERFDEVYNHFTEKDEPLVLWRDVDINDGELTLPYVWCGYSKTLEKFNLKAGDVMACVGELVSKKFKNVANVKINRPSQIDMISRAK